MTCCVEVRCVIIFSAVPCCAQLYCTMRCSTTFCYAMIWYVIIYFAAKCLLRLSTTKPKRRQDIAHKRCESEDARSASGQCARSAPCAHVCAHACARGVYWACACGRSRGVPCAHADARGMRRARACASLPIRSGLSCASGAPSRCLTPRPPSAAKAAGPPPQPRQLRELAPSLSHGADKSCFCAVLKNSFLSRGR